MKVKAVECHKCGVLHKENGSYFTVEGNIYNGESTEIVGNNFDAGGNISGRTYFCWDCLHKILSNTTINTRDELNKNIRI